MTDSTAARADAVSPTLPDVMPLVGPALPSKATSERQGRSRRGTETRRMSIVKPVRFTNAELADCTAAAEAAGQTIEDYLRSVATTAPLERGTVQHVTERAHTKYLRLTPEQAAEIAAGADRARLTFGSYVRARALKKPVTLTTPRRQPVDRAELARLLGLLGNLGSNVNQIARQLNSDGEVPLVDVRAAIEAVQAAALDIRDTLGRAQKTRDHR